MGNTTRWVFASAALLCALTGCQSRSEFSTHRELSETNKAFFPQFDKSRSGVHGLDPERQRIDRLIVRYALAEGVPVDLAKAVVRVESNFRPDARGRAGEVGLMQIKPATARGMGFRGSVRQLYDPETNIKWGMKYLGQARELASGNTCGTVSRYNRGLAAKGGHRTSRYCRLVMRHL